MTFSIGWTLLHFCWQGALLGALLALALTILRRARPQVRYAAACLTLLAMAIAPAITFLLLNRASSPPPGVANGGIDVAGMLPILVPTIVRPADHAAPWIALCWLAGVAIMTVRWGIAWALLQRRLARSGRDVPVQLAETMDRLRQRMSIAREIPVCVADWVESPAVCRWIRPILVVPLASIAGLSAAQIEAILAHELAHIRRHDYLVNLMQTAIETLLFYHPAVWWVSHRIRVEREHCCDDLAVAACGDRYVYASALAELAAVSAQPRFAMGATGASLPERVRRVLVSGKRGLILPLACECSPARHRRHIFMGRPAHSRAGSREPVLEMAE